MKKTNLMKAILVLVMGTTLILFSTSVFAATDDGFNELTLNNTSTNINTNTNTNTNKANTNINTNTNTNTNKANNTNANASNSSVYNNTNLPKTGVEDSIPVALLVAVFGISAVYAYRKIKEYKNI